MTTNGVVGNIAMRVASRFKAQPLILRCDAFLENSKSKGLTPER
jgi:hypothetical protein